MLSNCGTGVDSFKSPLDSKEIKPVNPKGNHWKNSHWKDWCWSRSSNTLATWCREPTPWKRSSCWERLRAGREGGDREWDGWMASLTQRPWVWASSGSWWWTGRPGLLQVHGVAKSQTRLSHGTTTNNYWAGHKVHSCFCASYKKTWTNFLASPVLQLN